MLPDVLRGFPDLAYPQVVRAWKIPKSATQQPELIVDAINLNLLALDESGKLQIIE